MKALLLLSLSENTCCPYITAVANIVAKHIAPYGYYCPHCAQDTVIVKLKYSVDEGLLVLVRCSSISCNSRIDHVFLHGWVAIHVEAIRIA